MSNRVRLRWPQRSLLVRWFFLRGLGLVYAVAFTSLSRQVLGLYGRRGIVPISDKLANARRVTGAQLGARLSRRPTIFWWTNSDLALLGACRAGQLFSLALVLNLAPRFSLAVLWALYLSFVCVGDPFLSFQWDALLLEASSSGLLAAPSGLRPKWGREAAPWQVSLLLRWLAFRLHFQSGLAKLRSGDRTWRNLTAVHHHLETQPLPTPPGWYARQLPLRVHQAATAAVLVLECVVPWATFGGRRVRELGFAALCALQLAIAATGNFAFFNVLSVVTLLWLLDHREPSGMGRGSRRALIALHPARHPARETLPRRVRSVLASLCAASLFVLSVLTHVAARGRRRLPGAVRRWLTRVSAIHSINSYGLFSRMTTRRLEVDIEGSEDGVNWQQYEYRYKLSGPQSRPRWIAPHQPRLDWQMWFAALGPPPVWFMRLVLRLLEGSPAVLALFRSCPFPERPPRYARAVLYECRIATLGERRALGAWWRRERLGLYLPVLRLSDEARPRRSLDEGAAPARAHTTSE